MHQLFSIEQPARKRNLKWTQVSGSPASTEITIYSIQRLGRPFDSFPFLTEGIGGRSRSLPGFKDSPEWGFLKDCCAAALVRVIEYWAIVNLRWTEWLEAAFLHNSTTKERASLVILRIFIARDETFLGSIDNNWAIGCVLANFWQLAA